MRDAILCFSSRVHRQHLPLLARLVMLAVFLFIAACGSNEPVAAKLSSGEQSAAKPVKTVLVQALPIERTIKVFGSLAAYDQATISAKAPGRLASIAVDFGSVVEQGQTLAQIEPRDYQLQIQQAEAALAQARVRLGLSPTGADERIDPEQTGTVRQARARLEEARQHQERLAALVEKGFIAKSDFDAAAAAYTVALSQYQDATEEIRNRQALLLQRRSELEIARQHLADTIIKAPFDGVIQTKHASVGEYLAPSAPVVTVVRMDPLRLRAEVPERAAVRVQAGQKVRLTVDGDSTLYEGLITRLGPTINEQNRMLSVEADVRNPGSLRPGSFARVDIVTNEADTALAVPTRAIVTFAGLEKVWIAHEGKAMEKVIATRQRLGEWTEVVDGVQVGDLVILDPGNLRAGQTVSIAQ
jgi:RND family efflux transporter MFP subunit